MDSVFLVDASLEMLRTGGGAVSLCLTDEMQKRSGLGGLQCIISVWNAVFIRVFISCFFASFCE